MIDRVYQTTVQTGEPERHFMLAAAGARSRVHDRSTTLHTSRAAAR
jgi:hypothetical protein